MAKLDAKYMFEELGIIPEDTNFGIKSNVVRSILESNEVDTPPANQSEISKSKLRKNDFQWHLLCLLLDDDSAD